MANMADDFPDDLEAPSSKKGSGGNFATIMIGVVILAAIVGLLWTFGPRLFSGSGSSKKDSGNEAQNYSEYVDFAQNFASTVLNISYTNINEQVQKAADFMDDDLLVYYKKNFLDPDFRQKLIEHKASCVYQRIERAQITKVDPSGQVLVRIDGTNTYNSDVNGAQIQLPYSIVINIKKIDGKLRVLDLKQRI